MYSYRIKYFLNFVYLKILQNKKKKFGKKSNRKVNKFY